MNDQPPAMLESLGLFGDGDEVHAITDVEECFAVTLDYRDAGTWRSVGDVYAALLAALPADRRNAPDIWPRFAAAIAGETGVDPLRIAPATLLLGTGRIRYRYIVLLAAAIGAIAAFFTHRG